jgi:hypothetical protein
MHYGNLRISHDSWSQNNVAGPFSEALGGRARQKLLFWFDFFRPAPKPPATPIYIVLIISFVSTFGIGRSMLGPIRRGEEAYRSPPKCPRMGHGNISLRLVGTNSRLCLFKV